MDRAIAGSLASKVAAYYRPIETELRMALIPKNQDGAIDGYENWTKPQIRELAKYYGQLITQCEDYAAGLKTARKPRAKKKVVKKTTRRKT